MNFDGSVGLTCSFCGSKAFFSDDDYKGNEKFRKMVLQYYKAEADKKDIDYNSDHLWTFEGRDSYTMQNGQMLNIEYMKKYKRQGMTFYIAKESVVYIFDKKSEAQVFLDKLRSLVFPAADVKLNRSFPELRMEIGLRDDKSALVFVRRPNCYPAEMFAPWESVHLAWVISRMENICCALRYSELEYGDVAPDSVFINPFTHEGMLFGDWRKVKALKGNADLKALRKTAVILAENTREPEEMYRFLNSEPASDAYSDFEKWDTVIEKGFGGHNFAKMKI